MNKGKARILGIFAILAVIFNIIVFSLPMHHAQSFWTAYCLAMLAFILAFFVCFFWLAKVRDWKGAFLRLPILYIVFGCLLTQVIVSGVFLFVAAPRWILIVLSCLVLGFGAINLLGVSAGRDVIEQKEQQVRQKASYVRELQHHLENLSGEVSDGPLQQALQALAERVRFSDPMSSEQLTSLEGNILTTASALEGAVQSGDDERAAELIKQIDRMVTQRNQQCKMLK